MSRATLTVPDREGSSGTPRMLFLAPKLPAAGISGDRIRNFHLIRELAVRGWRVHLFALEQGSTAVEERAMRDLSTFCERVLVAGYRPSRGATAVRMAVAVITRRAFHEELLASHAARQALDNWVAGHAFDVVLASQLPMYRYVRAEWRSKTVIDSHNHEATRIVGIAEASNSLARRMVARMQVAPVARYEREVVRRVAMTLAVSTAERDAFAELAGGRARLVPNGVDLDSSRQRGGPPAGSDVLFVGSLDYTANAEAVAHFISDIAPHIVTRDARFVIVGSNPPNWLGAAARRSAVPTDVVGFVDELEPVMRTSRVVVVPLLRGGGTRLKILEALAAGIPVVTTTAGCSGLDIVAGEHALVEDDPRRFAAAIDRLLANDALWTHISTRGRMLVAERYGWHSVGEMADAALREVARPGVSDPI